MSGDGLATTEQATAFENQRQTEIAKDEEKRQAEIAKARELFKTMEARKAELQKREAIAKLEREEIAKARKIIAEQKSSEIAGMIDETLTQIEEGQRAEAFFEAEKEKAHNNFRVDMRGTAVNNERQTPDLQKLNIAREQKISTETALQNQTRIQDMERKLSTSFERARPFITPRERAELVPLQEKLKMAQDLNDAEIYQSVVAQIQVKLNRYQNENPVTGFAKPLQATEQKPNIILTNPKTKPSLISKIGKFFGFGK